MTSRSERPWLVSAHPRFVVVLRDELRKFAAEAGLREPVLGDVAAAVFEALTDAVVHGHHVEGEGLIEMYALAEGVHLEITVRDRGPARRSQAGKPSLGFSLPLIASVAADYRISGGVDGANEIW